MRGIILVPMTAALLTLPAIAHSDDGRRTQHRISAERSADGNIRRTAVRRDVQRRAADGGVTVRRRAERRVTTRRVTDDGVTVQRRVDRRAERRREVRRDVPRPDTHLTKREKFQIFKRKLYARAHNAIADGARPAEVRKKVQQAIRKALRRLKASSGN